MARDLWRGVLQFVMLKSQCPGLNPNLDQGAHLDDVAGNGPAHHQCLLERVARGALRRKNTHTH